MTLRPLVKMLLITCILLGASSSAHADGGTVRLHQQAGPYLITVFTSPVPVRQGPVDISVLVQDAASGECVSKANITVRLNQPGTPRSFVQPATTAAATNKLMQAALFDLPMPGSWQVEIKVDGPDGSVQVHFVLDAGSPLQRWQTLWPWYTWPALAIILFGCHQLLVQRKAKSLSSLRKLT